MLQQVFNFLVLGSMYSIVALGYTLYFGTVNLVNFAHGALCTFAAFIFLLALSFISGLAVGGGLLGFTLAASIAVFVTVIVGLLSERFFFRPVRGKPPLEGLIISIAFSMLIREGILHFYPNGGNPQIFPDPFRLESVKIAGINLAYIQIVLVGICLIFAITFYWIVRKTHLGRIMRAVSQDAGAAVMLGLPVNRIICWAFAIGACFASIAGILNGAIYGSVKFDMGFSLGVKGFVAAVIGGLENPNGAFFGGMVLAFLETAVVALVPGGSAYRDILAFGILLTIFLIRPEGLFGGKTT